MRVETINKPQLVTRKKGNVEINVYGTVTGKLWMPSERVEFDIAETFYHETDTPFKNEWRGLRGSLRDIQNDGNYQNLDFTGEIEIHVKRTFLYIQDNRIKRESIHRRIYKFSKDDAPEEISDLFV